MDLTWKKAFSPVRDRSVSDLEDILYPDVTTLDGQPPGSMGDHIAAYIERDGSLFKAPAVVVANTVKTQRRVAGVNPAVAQEDVVVAMSRIPLGLQIVSWSDITQNVLY